MVSLRKAKGKWNSSNLNIKENPFTKKKQNSHHLSELVRVENRNWGINNFSYPIGASSEWLNILQYMVVLKNKSRKRATIAHLRNS